MGKPSGPTLAVAAAVVAASLLLGTRPAHAAFCDTPGLPTTTVYLPNITKTLGGPIGWVTPFIVQNVGAVATTIEVSFYRFSDGALITCRKVTDLLPYTSFADVPNNDPDLPGDSQFAVVVRSFGAQVVSVVNEHQAEGVPGRAEALSYTGLSSGATAVYVPFVGKPEPAPCSAAQPTELLCNLSWVTTLIMQNLGTSDATVTARFTSYDGASTASITRVIGPGRSRFIDPSVEPSLVAGRYYAATFTSTQPIGVIANAHSDAATNPLPRAFSYNGVPQPSPEDTFLPYVRRDGGPVRAIPSGVLIQNAGQADATPTLSFQRIGGGGAVTISAPTPIKPGAAWYFDPEIYALAGGYQLCAVAGAGKCIDIGEHSLVVSGGTFAVLDATAAASGAAAMGHSGSPGRGNRAYVPNVTRTLGGPSGWTTPIIIQSTGATSATLRWYRFADGALITRQTVGPLSRGASLRIDPRTVSGLSDNTQYAVVVDGTAGTLLAIVTELNFLGGDGTMAYEGFGATVSTSPAPTAIAVTPVTVTVPAGGSVQFAAVVKDQFDNALTAAVTWSSSPASLGTIGPGGMFVASASATGSGSVIATTGTLSATASVAVTPPTPVTFGAGTYIVGADIPPGTYRTRASTSGCYWERLRGFGGTLSEIIANELTNEYTVVTIKATDRGFRSTRCATWTNDLSAITSSLAGSFGAGAFIVGVDIAPGTWRAAGGSSCYWERLSGFGGELNEIVANGLGDAPAVVTIAASDKGFSSSGCGGWTKL